MSGAIAQYWTRSDEVGHLVFGVLLLMSLASWFILLAKAWAFWRVRRAAPLHKAFWQAPGIKEALAMLRHGDAEQVYSALAEAAVDAADPQRRAASLSAHSSTGEVVTRALRQELNRLTVRLESGLTVLASIGATAPFVGLLGTVWGIYHALDAISGSGSIQLEQLAGPVGEALIMTALGLSVAIPAVLAYNAFGRINRITLAELDAFAHDLHAHLSRAA